MSVTSHVGLWALGLTAAACVAGLALARGREGDLSVGLVAECELGPLVDGRGGDEGESGDESEEGELHSDLS